jgi:hypothetical protein
MIRRKQKESDDQAGECDGPHNLEKALLCIAIRRNHFVVEEPLQEVPHQKTKLGLFLRYCHRHLRLHFERENRKFRRAEDAQGAGAVSQLV